MANEDLVEQTDKRKEENRKGSLFKAFTEKTA